MIKDYSFLVLYYIVHYISFHYVGPITINGEQLKVYGNDWKEYFIKSSRFSNFKLKVTQDELTAYLR